MAVLSTFIYGCPRDYYRSLSHHFSPRSAAAYADVMPENEMIEVINNLRDLYNLEIDSPFAIEVNGSQFEFDCLIKGYGATKGMIVDSKWAKIEPVADSLVELGYGYSCFDMSGSSIEGFNEVLNDWGKINA